MGDSDQNHPEEGGSAEDVEFPSRGENPSEASLSPEQHERLKDHLHRSADNSIGLQWVRQHERRYLVIGRGTTSSGGRGPRQRVVDFLNERTDATAFRLEDFGVPADDFDLWAPAFEILAGQSTHIVGVLENFDGGHVWELGYLYDPQRREILWILKRVYAEAEEQRNHYDNGMAASHLATLEQQIPERVIEWGSRDDLPEAVDEIP